MLRGVGGESLKGKRELGYGIKRSRIEFNV
jgi:hypothetical protein